jgi:hypothetical protein
MKKILASIATSLMAASILMACNGSGTNSNDVTSEGVFLAKAVCTSSKNWKEVGIGMSASQVEERLGKPARIVTSTNSTEYQYERCRGGSYLEKAGTPSSGTTPAVPPEFMTYYFSGQVLITPGKGVVSVTPPLLKSDKPLDCEWDFYNYPTNYGNEIFVCRTSANPF